MPTYRSQFPDHIGMVTKLGDKFNFTGGLLETEDPAIIEILKERITRNKDVTEISEKEAESIKKAAIKSQSLEDAINENPNGETTISPQELMNRIRMTQAAQENEKIASAQLEVAKGINPQAGVVTSSKVLESAAPSNGTPKK